MAVNHIRLKQLFIEACDLPREAQIDFVKSRCDNDRELQAQLDRLLSKDLQTTGDSGFDSFAFRVITSELDEPLPQHIGRYRPLRRIGTGGMGIVYLATQDNPRREVAVKMIRTGHLSQHLMQRFELEAHVLGRLQHPNIAQILEAGMHEDGFASRPYFAMEYIEGVPLMEHIAAETPDVRTRLAMFITICDAVHHAHQRGVIHRDLKPTNILVTTSGQPKILDFGIARATDSDLQLTTMHTDDGKLIGTLAYMSPEQVAGRNQDVDTRCDIYSLGVILYELLTQRLPHELAGCSVMEAARMIANDDPAPLFTNKRNIRGDLNTIVMKALEKEPDRRYQSALHLAGDIERYLRDEPIIARPASRLYQIRKFAQRNRVLVAAVAAVTLALILGIVGTSVGMASAREQAREAERQREIAEAVNAFLNDDLLGSANPNTGQGRDVTVRAVLALAAENIDERFRDQPLVAASIRITLGRTYFGLAMYEDSQIQFREAVALYTQELGPGAEDTLGARRLHGTMLRLLWRLDEAEALLVESLAVAEQSLGPEHFRTADILGELAVIHRMRDRPAEAEDAYRRAIAIYDKAHGPGYRRRRAAINNLAMLLGRQKRYDESEALYRELLAVTREAAGPRHADTAFVLLNYSDVLWRQGKHDQAEPLNVEAYDIRQEVLGEGHHETIRALYGLGLLHRARRPRQGRASAAAGP